MPIPSGPLESGLQILLPIVVEVVADYGSHVAVLIPDGYGGRRDLLIPRAVLELGSPADG